MTTRWEKDGRSWWLMAEGESEPIGGTEQCLKRGGGRYALVRQADGRLYQTGRYEDEPQAKRAAERGCLDRLCAENAELRSQLATAQEQLALIRRNR